MQQGPERHLEGGTHHDSNQQRNGRHVDANGASFYVEEHRQGEPLVLVHPGLTSSAVYRGVVAGLAEQFLVVTFDSRGHGRSTNPSGALNYKLMTEDTASLIDALGLVRPVVGGWSDGGHVALEFGLRHPDRARALVVGAAFADFESQRANVRAGFQVDADGHVDADAFAREHAQTVLSMMQHMYPHGVEQMRAIVQMEATMLLTYPGLTAEQVRTIETPAISVSRVSAPANACGA